MRIHIGYNEYGIEFDANKQHMYYLNGEVKQNTTGWSPNERSKTNAKI
jgi:hypothetical protein